MRRVTFFCIGIASAHLPSAAIGDPADARDALRYHRPPGRLKGETSEWRAEGTSRSLAGREKAARCRWD